MDRKDAIINSIHIKYSFFEVSIYVLFQRQMRFDRVIKSPEKNTAGIICRIIIHPPGILL